ncbi:hypothetical protein [Methylobacterium sp. SI9]|uniref:hypothetical protein n=1 Tax=Methylobacterium guangdongense TaxID=3138811 RepID=UPI00313D6C20
MAEVHDLLLEAGPLSVDDTLNRLPPGWGEATRWYGKAGEKRTICPGKLREKVNGDTFDVGMMRASATADRQARYPASATGR